MKFCANVSILFKEAPFLERFERAARAGFNAVEFWWPADESLDEVEAAIKAAGLEVALFNFDAGELPKGDRGLLSDPARAQRFRENVPVALELAQRIGCERLNALVGIAPRPASARPSSTSPPRTSRWAADQAAAHGTDITIEAVNPTRTDPTSCRTRARPRPSSTPSTARTSASSRTSTTCSAWRGTSSRRSARSCRGSATSRSPMCPPAASPAPARSTTPSSSTRSRPGYGGWIGLEYNPSTATTEETLAWLPEGSSVLPEESIGFIGLGVMGGPWPATSSRRPRAGRPQPHPRSEA